MCLIISRLINWNGFRRGEKRSGKLFLLKILLLVWFHVLGEKYFNSLVLIDARWSKSKLSYALTGTRCELTYSKPPVTIPTAQISPMTRLQCWLTWLRFNGWQMQKYLSWRRACVTKVWHVKERNLDYLSSAMANSVLIDTKTDVVMANWETLQLHDQNIHSL